MLEKLHDKFEDERTDLEKEESNARHAYEMLIQDLTAQVPAGLPEIALSSDRSGAAIFTRAKVRKLHFAITR